MTTEEKLNVVRMYDNVSFKKETIIKKDDGWKSFIAVSLQSLDKAYNDCYLNDDHTIIQTIGNIREQIGILLNNIKKEKV